jgi:hypothetical protein
MCYDEVYIYKPKTSRPTNSEKYIVCKNFCISDEIRTDYTSKIKKLINDIRQTDWKTTSFQLFANIESQFIDVIRNANHSLVDIQCNFLDKAITLCNDINFIEKYDEQLPDLMENRKAVFKEWEEHYNLNSFV